MNLRCPICHNKLGLKDKSFYCNNNHCFDISKRGYVNLLISKSKSGDNNDMVKARKEFLNNGYYDFIIDKVASLLDRPIDNILDCGCGEGYFTEKLASKLMHNSIIGLDISKSAIEKCAKHSESVMYVIGNIYHLPVLDNSIDVIFNICAPHFNNEFKRVLKEDGLLVKIVPGQYHMYEIKKLVYSKPYLNSTVVNELDDFEIIKEIELFDKKLIDKNNLLRAWQMTPYYYRTSKDDLAKLNKQSELEVTFAFKIYVYKVK